MRQLLALFSIFGSLAVLLPACSSSRIEIRSLPDGAEVRSISGEVLGKTPLELNDEQKSKVVENGIASFRVFATDHESRLVMLDASGLRNVQVSLPAIQDSIFKSEIAKERSKDFNRFLRDAFSLHQALAQQKIPEAEKLADEFKKNYPQIALGYIISAQISLLQAKATEARTSLERAKALDPDDASIDQNLKLLRGEQKPEATKP